MRKPTRTDLLRACAEAGPALWFPSEFARSNDLPRAALDPLLNELRLARLIEIMDWQKGKGQGYALTAQGREVLASAKSLADPDRSSDSLPKPTEPINEPPIAPITTYEKHEAVRRVFLQPLEYRSAVVLIAVNGIVFLAGLGIAMSMGKSADSFLAKGNTEALHITGALQGRDILNGEWWRLLTACFVHYGMLHLIANTYSIYVLVPLSELMWTRGRMLILYILSGISGSAIATLSSPDAQLAGASAAVCGLLGAMAAWLMLNRAAFPSNVWDSWAMRLLPIFIVNIVISTLPGISAAAHFGGGVVGFLLGMALNSERFAAGPARIAPIVFAASVVGIVLLTLAVAPQHDIRWAKLRPAADGKSDLKIEIQPQLELLHGELIAFQADLTPALQTKTVDGVLLRRLDDQLFLHEQRVQRLLAKVPAPSNVKPDQAAIRETCETYLKKQLQYLDLLRPMLRRATPPTSDEFQKVLTIYGELNALFLSQFTGNKPPASPVPRTL